MQTTDVLRQVQDAIEVSAITEADLSKKIHALSELASVPGISEDDRSYVLMILAKVQFG